MKHSKLYWFFCDIIKWIGVFLCSWMVYVAWTWEFSFREGLELSGRISISIIFIFLATFSLVLCEKIKNIR